MGCTIRISDPKLRAYVAKFITIMTSVPEALRAICGLVDGYEWYSRAGKAKCPQAREALKLLRSRKLRPVLRQWYSVCPCDLNPYAARLRQRLNKLVSDS